MGKSIDSVTEECLIGIDTRIDILNRDMKIWSKCLQEIEDTLEEVCERLDKLEQKSRSIRHSDDGILKITV